MTPDRLAEIQENDRLDRQRGSVTASMAADIADHRSELLAYVAELEASHARALELADETKLALLDERNRALIAGNAELDLALAERDQARQRVAELEAAIGQLMQIPLHEHDRHWCAHDRDITRALGDVQPAPSGEAIAGILGSLAARTRTPDPSPVDDLPGMWDQSDLTGGETDTHTPRRGERGER